MGPTALPVRLDVAYFPCQKAAFMAFYPGSSEDVLVRLYEACIKGEVFMANFYRGKAYSLLRTHGRPINMRALASWLGKRFSHTLFLVTPRDDSRYGLRTIPKIRRGRYLIERPDWER